MRRQRGIPRSRVKCRRRAARPKRPRQHNPHCPPAEVTPATAERARNVVGRGRGAPHAIHNARAAASGTAAHCHDEKRRAMVSGKQPGKCGRRVAHAAIAGVELKEAASLLSRPALMMRARSGRSVHRVCWDRRVPKPCPRQNHRLAPKKRGARACRRSSHLGAEAIHAGAGPPGTA
eukprot:365641-Chlamydomonas_euryale.AAC.12